MTILQVNGKKVETLTFTENDMAPQDVSVTYNNATAKLTVTEVNLMLKLLVKLE